MVDFFPVCCPVDGWPYVTDKGELLRRHLGGCKHGPQQGFTKVQVTTRATEELHNRCKRQGLDGSRGTCIRREDGKVWCTACGEHFKLWAYGTRHEREGRCPALALTVVAPTLRLQAGRTEVGAAMAASKEPQAVACYGKTLETVREFKYLGRVLTDDDRDDREVKRRCEAARGAFVALSTPLFRNKCASKRMKLLVAQTVCRSILMYGAETWVISKAGRARVDRLQQSILRRCLGMHCKVTRSPTGEKCYKHPRALAVLRAANQQPWSQMVDFRQAQWYGHVLRMGKESMVRKSYLSSVVGVPYMGYKTVSSVVGRMTALVEKCGIQPQDAANRVRWRTAISVLSGTGARGGTGPCPTVPDDPP